MSGVAQLAECVATILMELRELREEVKKTHGAEDMTRPLKAEEVCERLGITARTPKLKLFYLARRCRQYGLAPLAGSRGWNALYRRADVLRAEEHAAGKIRGRKSKRRQAA